MQGSLLCLEVTCFLLPFNIPGGKYVKWNSLHSCDLHALCIDLISIMLTKPAVFADHFIFIAVYKKLADTCGILPISYGIHSSCKGTPTECSKVPWGSGRSEILNAPGSRMAPEGPESSG